MTITKQRFVTINKYALWAAIIVYLYGLFVTKIMQIGIFFALAAGFFNLLHQKYFIARPRLAAHIWLLPAVIGVFTYPMLMEKQPSGQNAFYFMLTLLSA